MKTLFSPPEPNESVEEVIRNLVLANHILALKEVVDAFGHVSQRCPWNPSHFMIARSVAPASVTERDMVELDLDGNTVDPDAPPSYLERFIHAEVYRARPDVRAVVHSHSPAVIPFAVVPGVSLRSIFHLTGFLGVKPPVFEIRDTAGDGTDLLVRSAKSGAALAACLGDASTVLMRGHGSTTVGRTLPEAVFNAVYTEVNARVQYQAMQLGSPTYLSEGEAAAAAATTAGAMDRAWQLWVLQVTSDRFHR